MNKDLNEFYKNYLEEAINEIMLKAKRLDLRYINEGMEEMTSILEKHFNKIIKDENKRKCLVDFIKELDLTILLNQIINEGNKKIIELGNEDKRISKLLSLIEQADKLAPNISLIILSRINPNDYINKATRPNDLIELAEEEHGEYRASCLMRFILGVCESSYDNYVRILWEILSVLEGKIEIKSNDKFGNIINNLIPKLNKIDMLDLIEPKAAIIRNAAAHESYDYDAKTNSVIIQKTNKEKISIGVDELYIKAKGMYQLTSMPLFLIFIMNINKKFFDSGILDFLLNKKEKLISGETIDMEDVKSAIDKMFVHTNGKYHFRR